MDFMSSSRDSSFTRLVSPPNSLILWTIHRSSTLSHQCIKTRPHRTQPGAHNPTQPALFSYIVGIYGSALAALVGFFAGYLVGRKKRDLAAIAALDRELDG